MKNVFAAVVCFLWVAQGISQNIVKFEANARAYYCPNPGFNFFVTPNGLTVSNAGGARCDSVTLLELQVHNFTGPGTYTLTWSVGNYGFFSTSDTPPAMETPVYSDDPGGGTVNILRYDSILGILEGTFSMVVSRHMFDTTDMSTTSITNGYFSFGTCYAVFNVAPDTIPHHWLLYYRAQGVQPVSVTFHWGDGSSTSGNATHTYNTPGNYDICMTVNDNAGCTATYCDSSVYIYKQEDMIAVSVFDLLSTGINEMLPDASFEIFPNPASGSFSVSAGYEFWGGMLTISDLTGRKVFTIPFSASKTQVETEILPAGAYLVSLTSTGGRTFTKKLIVYK